MAGLDWAGGGMALTGFTLNEIIKQHTRKVAGREETDTLPLGSLFIQSSVFGDGSKLTSDFLPLCFSISIAMICF